MNDTKTTTAKWVDSHTHKPTEAGWYAVLICWDSQEGHFPRGLYWDGENWPSGNPVSSHSPQTFPSEGEATTWAYMNDPDL